MNEIYNRNRIYISPEEQKQIKNFRIVMAGAGLGSVIAECALRLGFENICLIDGDRVELSNLNRQNYTFANTGKPKASAIRERLQAINPDAKIEYRNIFLTETNIRSQIQKFDLAINAIDFDSMAPFLFDEVCVARGMTVLHPYNLGWAGCVFAVSEKSRQLSSIQEHNNGFEKAFVKFLLKWLNKKQQHIDWLQNVLEQYENETQKFSPPQLSVASWLTAGMCVNIMFRAAVGKAFRQFPDLYFLTSMHN
jgi:molybdopterin-synthase adenylyltransferase